MREPVFSFMIRGSGCEDQLVLESVDGRRVALADVEDGILGGWRLCVNQKPKGAVGDWEYEWLLTVQTVTEESQAVTWVAEGVLSRLNYLWRCLGKSDGVRCA